MNPPRYRRVGVSLVALLVAAVLFRPQISLAVVSRGDDFLYRSQTNRAATYYRRALLIDPESAVAADRLAFFSARLDSSQHSQENAVEVASRFLQRHEDAAVRMDRALAYLRLRRYASAERDFQVAAVQTRDPRYLTFAGWAAWRRNARAEARRLWRSASLTGYRPATTALRAHK